MNPDRISRRERSHNRRGGQHPRGERDFCVGRVPRGGPAQERVVQHEKGVFSLREEGSVGQVIEGGTEMNSGVGEGAFPVQNGVNQRGGRT